jgi:Zn ribbon nucleic-acid-binding protein
MRHKWQLLERKSNVVHRHICVRCGIFRKSKNRQNNYRTSYSGGYQAYSSVPSCKNVMELHNWRDKKEVPWESCVSCGSHRLVAVVGGGYTIMVWFRRHDKNPWTNDYFPCT